MAGRLIGLILLALLVVLQQRLWLGSGGLIELRYLRQEEQQKQDHIRGMKTRNARMATEVRELKTGLDLVEEYARNRLGLIQPGEIYYQIPGPDAAPKPGTPP